MATVGELKDQLDALNAQVAAANSNNDQLFLIVMGIFVLFMQGGFAFLEAGSVRSKNTTNILMKNILDVFIGAVSYYLFGFAFAYGEPSNAFIGHNTFAAGNVRTPNGTDTEVVLPEAYYALWFYQFVFAATASTIVSGAVAERTEFVAYLVYCLFLTGFIYPIVSHWAWSSTGWLASGAGTGLVFQDFAGSAVVHITGGTAALVGAILVGPRIGKFKKDGTVGEINHHSITVMALGAFVLYIGFMAFNGGSQLAISNPGDGAAVSTAIVNTILGGSAGGMVAMGVYRINFTVKCGPAGKPAFWSCLMTINGGLAGMVALCAGCDDLYPWAAIIIGSVAGLSLIAWHSLMIKLKIDDPLDAVAVHLGGGLTGILLTPIFATNGKLGVGGIIYGGHDLAFKSFGWNLCGAVVIIAWVAVTSTILFGTLKFFNFLRVSELVEIAGLDGFHHGEQAYPLSSYQEAKLPAVAGYENGAVEETDETKE